MSRRWWEKVGIDLEGAKKRAEEAATDLDSELDVDLGGDEPSEASG